MRKCLYSAILLSLAAAGCGGSKDSEIPKNPVPMEKPGQSAIPQGVKPGGAPPGEKARSLK